MSKMIKCIVCLFICMILCLDAVATAAEKSIVTYGSANTINAMAVDGDWLWCATEGGVVRWNTRDFTYTIFTVTDGLGSNSVKCIAIAPDGTVWAGTMNGASHYNGSSWKTFTQEDGLVYNAIGAVAIDHQGTAWFAAHKWFGVSRYENGTWTSFPKMEVKAIAVGLDDTVWFAAWRDGIKCYKDGAWSQFTDSKLQYRNNLSVGPDGVVWVISDNEINWYADGKWNTASNSTLQTVTNPPQTGAKDGICWAFSGPETGVIRVDSNTRTAHRIPFPTQYPFVMLNAIAVGQDDAVWFGSRAGVFRFDGSQWSPLRVNESLASNLTTQLSVGPEGVLWVGTREGGVSSFDGTRWRTYTRADGLADECIMAVAAGPGKTAWIASYNPKTSKYSGISRFDGTKWETYTPSTVLPSINIVSLGVSADGTLWVATERTITRFDGSQWTGISSPESSFIYSMAVDPSGTVWICTESRGVFKLENGEWVSAPPDQNFHGELPRKMAFGEENAYFANNYVYAYTDNQWKGIGGIGYFSSLAVGPYGEPWIGYEDGAWIYNGFTWTKHHICEHTIGSMICDGSDGMWIGTGFEGVKHMTAPAGIYGKVCQGETNQGIPGAVVLVSPKDYVLYTDERGEFRIPDISFGTYTLKARAKEPGSSGYTEVAREGITVSSDAGAEVNLVFPGNITGISDQPAAFRVGEPYPNPFNPSTSISFTLPQAERVTLTVYDITGRKIRDLISGPLSAGLHSASWDGRDASGREVSSGVYIARLTAGRETVSRKMSLLR